MRVASCLLAAAFAAPAWSQVDEPDLEALKALGASRSRYHAPERAPDPAGEAATDLAAFRAEIEPALRDACSRCHGPDRQRGGLRIDELDPDLVNGDDVDVWIDVLSAISDGEMPPEGESDLAPADRGRIVEWLSTETQRASAARRASAEHSSFRRLTRYEYEYALQDLLGLPYAFGDDLPPDPVSEDGFHNSSETLHLSPTQLRAYLDSGRAALESATVRGERPTTLHWDVSMDAAAAVEWKKQDRQLADVRKKHADDAAKLAAELARLRRNFVQRHGGTYFLNRITERTGRQGWNYGQAKYAWAPSEATPGEPATCDHVAVLPRGQGLLVEVGEKIPERGALRVRVLASRASIDDGPAPGLQLWFGWQASNDSRAVVRVSERDLVVDAPPLAPEVYEFVVPLRDLAPRNGVRTTAKLGDLPSPSEYVRLVNGSLSGGAIHVHHVQIAAPVYASWPPASHTRIFPRRERDEREAARAILADFLPRAWRRPVADSEVARKLALFERLRPEFDDFEAAVVEVLAVVLSSPNFLYVGVERDGASEVAERLSTFLWCSGPDDELLRLAAAGALDDPETVRAQVARMLSDERAERFATHFTRQWLGLSLLDHLRVDRKAYPRFDDRLRDGLAAEPVAFFREVLARDLSVLEFLHADFTMANERLARHYGLEGVTGNHLRRVEWGTRAVNGERGGLLTQAGLLAMNSDGTDSHPLKRGVWMLERLLDDPPPPPPPAVPEIDLADPEIAKLTLKERIEDHRDDPACLSCHQKIDPWGIAFENYDATGSWRDEVGGRPVDSRSVLFNGQALDGMQGLKRFLLENRQDQFVRAMVDKLTSYALGRPLTFEDRAAVDAITADVRASGDGLATMIARIAASDLFRGK